MKRNLLQWRAWLPLLLVGAIFGCNSAWVSSGILYQNQGNWAKAEAMFRKGLWYNEEDAPAHFYLAGTLAYRAENEFLADGQLDSARIKLQEAYDHYQEAAKLDPEKFDYNPDATKAEDKHLSENGIQSMYAKMYNQGVKFMQAQNYDDAITYFDLATICDPRGKNYFKAKLLSLQLQYNQAIPEGEQADEATLQAILDGFNELEVGDWEDADADRQDLVKAKASVYRALGNETRANELYEELLAENPDDFDLLRNVAQARIEAGNRAGANELYERAIDILASDPDKTDAQRFRFTDRAITNAILGELYPEAIALADRAASWASSSGDRAKLARAKARAYFEMEDFDLAVQTLEPVVVDGGLDPTNPEAWQIYYLALSKIGRDAEAMKARERYQELKGL